MMKIFVTTLCWLLTFTLTAQVSINNDGTAPASNAMLDIKSNNKGVQFPRMTSAERAAIAVTAADAGLMVYDLTKQALYMFDGVRWFPFAFGGNGQPVRSQPYNGVSGNAGMGTSCAISGEYAVVGAPSDSVNNAANCGSAIVFKIENGTWVQKARLVAPDPKSWEKFGISVTIEDANIVVGGSSAYIGATQQGAAYYFTRTGETWTFQQKIFANDGEYGADFGNTVQLQGNSLFVGSKDKKVGNNTEQGVVYVLTKSGNTWSHLTQLKANDGLAGDMFGSSLAVSQNTIVVGAPKDDDAQYNQGSFYIFSRSGNTFTFQKKFSSAGLPDYAEFGTAVSIDGDYIVCGVPGADMLSDWKRGMVFLYKRTAGEWSQLTVIYTNGASEIMGFGSSVKLKNGFLVVGAPNESVDGFRLKGAVHIYKFNPDYPSNLVRRLTDPDGLDADYFGSAFDFYGNNIVIGAKGASAGIPANGNTGRVLFGRIE